MSSTAFARSERFFDLVAAAAGRDVPRESDALARRALEVAPQARTLLDAACRTGAVAAALRERFDVAGRDADPTLWQIARSRTPAIDVALGSIADLPPDPSYDVVVALRGAVAEARSNERLHEWIERLAAARAPGGVVMVEPYLDPDRYVTGAIEAVHVDEPRVKISRMIVTKRVAHLAVLDYHYLIASNQGVERHFERIERGLYARSVYERGFELAGLTFEALEEPAFPAGLYRGV